MCRAMTGEKPPVAANRVMEEEFEWLSHREIPGFSVEFRQAVDWALRVKPQERPQDLHKWMPVLEGGWGSKASPPEVALRSEEPLPTLDSHDEYETPAADAFQPQPATASRGQASVPWLPLAVIGGMVLLIIFFGRATNSQDSPAALEPASSLAEESTAQELDEIAARLREEETRQEASGSKVINVPNDHATIAAALASAKAGDTVLVAPGVYEECIKLVSGVALRGSDRDTTIIRNVSSGMADYGRLAKQDAVVSANNISSAKLSNLTIDQLLEQTTQQRYPAISVADSVVHIENCLVRSSGHGVAISGATGGSAVTNCRIENCGWNGISVSDNTGNVELRGNFIINNEENGIGVWENGRATVKDNTCQGNKLSGIVVQDSSVADVLNNTASENRQFGIWFGSGSSGRVENNSCNRNTFSGLGFRGASTRVHIESNEARNNGGNGIAVETVCQPLSFAGNSATSNEWEPQIDLSATWND